MKPLKRILPADDVPAIQRVTRIALEKLGSFEVLSCQSDRLVAREVLSKPFAPLQLPARLSKIWEAAHE